MAADSQGKVRVPSGSVIAARPGSGAPFTCSDALLAHRGRIPHLGRLFPCLHVHVPRV